MPDPGLGSQIPCLIYALQPREGDIIINQSDLVSNSDVNKSTMHSMGLLRASKTMHIKKKKKNNLSD